MLKHANEHFFSFRTQAVTPLTWKFETSDCVHDPHSPAEDYCKCSCKSEGGDAYMRHAPEQFTVDGGDMFKSKCKAYCEEGDGKDQESIINIEAEINVTTLY